MSEKIKNKEKLPKKEKGFYYRYEEVWYSRRFFIPTATFLIVLCLIAIVLGIIFPIIIGGNENKPLSKNIASGSDFVNCIRRISFEGEETNLKELILVDDITLTKNNVENLRAIRNRAGTTGAWYYGSLIGQGRTISFEDDVVLEAPLFDTIVEGAIIENLSIVNATLNVDNVKGGLAVVAMSNKGTIRNVCINGLKITGSSFGEKDISVAGITVNNLGAVSNCAVKMSVDLSNKFLSNNKVNEGKITAVWNCRFGAVAAVNGLDGKIHDVIIDVNFGSSFAVLKLAPYNMSKDRNLLVGYAIGGENNNSNVGNIYTINCLYKQFSSDRDLLSFTEINKLKSLIGNGSWSSWGIDETKNDGFPYLSNAN